MADTSTITKTNVCFLKEIMTVTIWPLVNDDLKKTKQMLSVWVWIVSIPLTLIPTVTLEWTVNLILRE